MEEFTEELAVEVEKLKIELLKCVEFEERWQKSGQKPEDFYYAGEKFYVYLDSKINAIEKIIAKLKELSE